MIEDATIRLRFKLTKEGGRKSAVSGEYFSCPLMVDGEAFDCRLDLRGKTLELGQTYDVAIKFLRPDLALASLGIGKAVTLWERKIIATGTVLSIVGKPGDVSSIKSERN